MDADSPVVLLEEQLKGGLVVEFELEDLRADEAGGPASRSKSIAISCGSCLKRPGLPET
jgi:hypothetical protein